MMIFLSCFLMTFVGNPLLSAESEPEIKFLDNGGVFYRFTPESLKIPSHKQDLTLTKTGIVFKRSPKDRRYCMASTDNIVVSHADGHLIVYPEFTLNWLGSLDPCKTASSPVASFEINLGSKRRILHLTQDLSKKEWLSCNKDGLHFYIGSMEQHAIDAESYEKNSQEINLIEPVNEGDEVTICLSYIHLGTEFELKALTVLSYPFRNGN